MHTTQQSRNRNAKRGVVLLYAVLISSIVLAVGLGLFNIASREVALSALGRDSQLAFFFADTGVECASYWDRKWFTAGFTTPVFATSDSETPSNPPNGVSCGAIDIASNGAQDGSGGVWFWNTTLAEGTTRFLLKIPDRAGMQGPCARVEVHKLVDTTSNPGKTTITTTITSRGENICNENDSRSVQRIISTQRTETF